MRAAFGIGVVVLLGWIVARTGGSFGGRAGFKRAATPPALVRHPDAGIGVGLTLPRNGCAL